MSLPHQILLSILAIILLRLLHKIYKWRLRLNTFRKTMPAIPVLFCSFSPLRRLVPKRLQTFHVDWPLQSRHQIYEALGSDIFALVSLFDYDEVQVCDPIMFSEIKSQWERWPKDVERVNAVALYGQNVLTAEGKVWKKHRKITARAFNPKTIQIVHAETIRQTQEMLKCLQREYSDEEVVLENVHGNTLKITLHVFFAAGFGHPFEWDRSDDVWQGHTLSPVAAISTVVDHLLAYLFIPKRILNLPVTYFRKITTAYNEAGQYYREFIELEKKGLLSKGGGAKTVLGQLVSNSFADAEGEVDDERLTDEEIIGNIFIFIIAGYETSANALMYAIYLLALNPKVQQTLFTEIQSVCGDELPSMAHHADLVYTTCVLYETMRLFPLVTALAQRTPTNQMFQGKYLVPAGTAVALDMCNTERNPKYWERPDDFCPERFDGRENPKGEYVEGKIKFPLKNAFIGFGDGPRACLGRKFAEMEIITCLAVIAQKWTFHLKEGWTKGMVWEVLNASSMITSIRPRKNIPIVLKRR